MGVHKLTPQRMPINTCSHCDHNSMIAGLVLFGVDGTPSHCGCCGKPWRSVAHAFAEMRAERRETDVHES